MEPKVLRNTSAYLLAGLLPYGVNFLMLPIYTRFLSPSDYGALALLNTFSALLLTFLSLQMGNSFVRFYYELSGREVRLFVSTVTCVSLVLNLVLLVPFMILGGRVARLLFPTGEISFYPYIVLALAGSYFTALITNFNLLLRVKERGRAVFLLAAWNVSAHTLLQVYFVVVRGAGAAGVLLATAINAVLILAAQVWLLSPYLIPAVDRRMLFKAVRYSWPLIPHALSAILLVYTDKLVLSYFVPLAQIGLYNIGQRFAAILELLVRSFKDANAPMFMRGSLTDRMGTVQMYRRLITRWAALTTVAYLALAFYAREVILLLTAPAFHGAQVFVPVLAGAFLFRGLYFFFVNALLFEKRTLSILYITVVAGLLNVAGNLLLVPRFGSIGAAYATLAAHASTFVLAYLSSRRWYRLELEWLRLGEIFGLAAACVLALTLWQPGDWRASLALKTLVLLAYAAYVVTRHIGSPLALIKGFKN